MLFAQNVYYMYANRILCGFYGGGVFVIVPTYLSEIANDRCVRFTCVNFRILRAIFKQQQKLRFLLQGARYRQLDSGAELKHWNNDRVRARLLF